MVLSCSPQQEEEEQKTKVELITTKGTIVLELSNKTPQHRDNFIKLVNEGFYDSIQFHRVVEGFGIQTGNPRTRDESDTTIHGLDYTIPAEIHPDLFHKRGALNAARNNNPERRSAASQFFLVQGNGPIPDSIIDRNEERINTYLSEYYAMNDPKNAALKEAFLEAQENREWRKANEINDSIRVLAETQEFERYTIPEEHREVYRTIGGASHLDQNYTVWGEVIQGMDVVDSIAAVPVDGERPIDEVRILTARVIEAEGER